MSNLFDVIKNKMKKQNFYKGHMSLGGPVIMRENNGSDATWGACYYFYFLNPCHDNFSAFQQITSQLYTTALICFP
jgi:hypothetical protein